MPLRFDMHGTAMAKILLRSACHEDGRRRQSVVFQGLSHLVSRIGFSVVSDLSQKPFTRCSPRERRGESDSVDIISQILRSDPFGDINQSYD